MRPDCEADCKARIEAETRATVQLLTLHAPGLKWSCTNKPHDLVSGYRGYRGQSPHLYEPLLPHLPMSISIHWWQNEKGWDSRFNDIRFNRDLFKTPEEAVDAALAHAKKLAEDILDFCKSSKEPRE